MSESWYHQGYDRVDEEEKKQKLERERKFKPDRFWVWVSDEERPDGKDVIFLDDNPVCIHEHYPTIYKDGERQWKGHQYTCRAGIDPEDPLCLMCEEDVRRNYVGFYTVVDCSEWTNREGILIKNTRKLFAAKTDALKILRDRSNRCKQQQKKKGDPITGLVGARFHVKRLKDKDPTEGTDFVYLEHEAMQQDADGKYFLSDKEYWWTDRDKNQHAPDPYDYRKILAPLTNEDMKKVLRGQVRQKDVFDQQIDKRKQESKKTSYI